MESLGAALAAFLVGTAVLVVSVGFWASVIAVILNLPLSGPVRFLLIAAALWAYWLLFAVQKVQRVVAGKLAGLETKLDRLETWTRLAFIAVELRNEAQGLPAAWDRLEKDRRRETLQRESPGIVELLNSLITGAAFLIIFGALLQFGTFGPEGAGWLSRLIAR